MLQDEFQTHYSDICDILKALYEDEMSQMLAGRDFRKPYPYAVNYVMEMLMIILNEKQDKNREPDRWAMHLRVCFGNPDDKNYDRKIEFDKFLKRLVEFDYKTI